MKTGLIDSARQRNRVSKKLTVGLILAILFSMVVLSQLFIQGKRISKEKQSRRPLSVGESVILPDSLSDVFGEKIPVRGLVLFLFFDPNCASCVDEAPIWDDFHQREGHRVRVVGISQAPKSVLRNFIDRLGISYHIVSDAKSAVLDQFHIPRIPYSVLVRDRRIEVVPSMEEGSPSLRLKEVEDHLGVH